MENYKTRASNDGRGITYTFPVRVEGNKTWQLDLDCYNLKGRGYIAYLRPVTEEKHDGYTSTGFDMFSGKRFDSEAAPRFNAKALREFAARMLARFQAEYTAYSDVIEKAKGESK